MRLRRVIRTKSRNISIRYAIVAFPGLSAQDMADEQTLKVIQREYMIEFACENRRYWDVRRGVFMKNLRNQVFTACTWEKINMDIIRLTG